MDTDTQKVTRSVKPDITHQIKSYSNVKTIWRSVYTCFSVFAGIGASQGNLAQIHQIFGRDTQKIIQRVKPQTPHQIKPHIKRPSEDQVTLALV